MILPSIGREFGQWKCIKSRPWRNKHLVVIILKKISWLFLSNIEPKTRKKPCGNTCLVPSERYGFRSVMGRSRCLNWVKESTATEISDSWALILAENILNQNFSTTSICNIQPRIKKIVSSKGSSHWRC